MIIKSDPLCYSLNSIALGDVLAAAPVVKYAVEHFHKDTDYKVLVRPYYWDIFKSFLPEDKIGDQGKPHSFVIPWQIRYLNTPKSGNARTTAMHMHLGTFASIQLLNRVLPLETLNYLPLPVVDISRFNFDVENSVFIIVTYRDDIRRISHNAVTQIAAWVTKNRMTPVFIGRVDDSEQWKDSPFQLAIDSVPDGVNLVNQTSLLELASLMAKGKAVVGMDSGPIHLAGTTSVPIVCGFTNVAPEHRIPIRKKGKFIPVQPDVECRHCQSYWHLNYHDFGYCYFKHSQCLSEFTGKKFISALKKAIRS